MSAAGAGAQRLTDLWVEHADAVRRFAVRRVPVDDVEDVVAETFTVVWARLDHVPDQALPWIYAVARNVIGTRLRSSRRRSALVDRVALEPAEQEPAAEVGALERLHLAQAWAQLNEGEREVLALAAWEGLSSTEAATVLQCQPSTYAVRLLRARRRMVRLLERGAGQQPGSGEESKNTTRGRG